MEEKESSKAKGRYVYVKDKDGVEYICRMEDLKKSDELTEEEKAACMVPPGSG